MTTTLPYPALILIDLQKGILDPKLGQRNNPEAEAHIATLLAAWRHSGNSIVHVRHISRSSDSVFRPGQPGAEFQDAFQPHPHEHVLEKNVPDAFCQTGLERWLRVRDLQEVVIVGGITNNSVESTARSAGNLSFTSWVISDATFTFGKVDFAGVHRTAEEVHAMSLANLQGEYATVLSTTQMLLRLGTDSQHR